MEGLCLLQVFAHSAQMEWFSEHNDKVPRNIYELGLKTFAKERRFISAYATFLLSQVCKHVKGLADQPWQCCHQGWHPAWCIALPELAVYVMKLPC